MARSSNSAEITIGELSRRTGVNIETIRYYERSEILPKPARSAGGHRLYTADQAKRLTFIRRSRELGFTLAEVRTLGSMADDRRATCADVHRLTTAHLQDVRQKLADLARLETVLADMIDECGRGEVPECPIIDALFDG